jgi:UPF0042 nucleotide-binding protein
MKKVENKKKESQSDIELMILTGLSGAGKSEALGYFEDSKVNKIALSIDLRSGYFFDEIYRILEELKEKKIKFRILFLEASKSVITKRFSLTRRKHPLVDSGNLGEGIEKEIKRMERLRDKADVIIDTTFINAKELRVAITERLMTEDEKSRK